MTRGLIGAALLVAGSASEGVTLFQPDTFAGGSLGGWEHGVPTSGSPINVPSGGPGGAGDPYLRVDSNGIANAPASRLVVFNSAQWTGDYLGTGVTAIVMDVQNLGPTALELRLAFQSSPILNQPSLAIGTWYAGTETVFLPAGGGWTRVSFAIRENEYALTVESTGSDSWTEVMSNVTFMRILSAGGAPTGKGDEMVAQLGVDNIVAIPEPSSGLLGGIGLAFLFGRRRR